MYMFCCSLLYSIYVAVQHDEQTGEERTGSGGRHQVLRQRAQGRQASHSSLSQPVLRIRYPGLFQTP